MPKEIINSMNEIKAEIKNNDVIAGIKKLKEQIKDLKKEVETAQNQTSAPISEEVIGDTKIVVAVVESLEGQEVEEYANNLFRTWGIGDKEKNNGILLLVSTGDRKIRIEVGYGLEGALNDGKTGAILDNYVVPYLKKEEEVLKNISAIFLMLIINLSFVIPLK